MGFETSKADPDVWMQRNGDVWEYIAVYVDDLAIAAKNLRKYVIRSQESTNINLKE